MSALLGMFWSKITKDLRELEGRVDRMGVRMSDRHEALRESLANINQREIHHATITIKGGESILVSAAVQMILDHLGLEIESQPMRHRLVPKKKDNAT